MNHSSRFTHQCNKHCYSNDIKLSYLCNICKKSAGVGGKIVTFLGQLNFTAVATLHMHGTPRRMPHHSHTPSSASHAVPHSLTITHVITLFLIHPPFRSRTHYSSTRSLAYTFNHSHKHTHALTLRHFTTHHTVHCTPPSRLTAHDTISHHIISHHVVCVLWHEV